MAMSRRKQAKPRAVKKDENEGEEDSPDEDRNPIKRMEAGTIPDNRTDDERSIASNDSELSVGGCSSSWEGESEDGRGSLTATPTSSSEETVSGTGASASDVEASSTVGVTDSTPYQCGFCHLAFPKLSYLKKHEQVHADLLPFRCDYCGRHFKHKRSRDRHIKLHTGDKKYKCTQCEAAFSRSDHLKIHLKTHDTQKPYRCTVCTRGYSTSAALTAHMQNHKARASETFAHMLKDVCDETTLISRFIKDSTGNGTKSEKFNAKNVTAAIPAKMQAASEAIQISPNFSNTAAKVQCQLRQSQDGNDRPLSASNQSVGSSGERNETCVERPSSLGNQSVGSSSFRVEVSPTASSPLSRPASVVTSPRPMNLSSNPFLALVGTGKLICPFCSCDGFPSFEAFQLHIQSVHGSSFSGDFLGGLPSTLASFRTGLLPPMLSPLGSAGPSRQVTCELCGARVSGVTALQRHVVVAHSFTDLLARAAEGVFCAQCLLPFSNPGALTEHIKLVHSTPASALSLLNEVLTSNKRPPSPLTPTDLSKKSRRDCGDALPSSTFLCNQCNAPFADFESFRTHLKEHLDGSNIENGKVIGCSECEAHLGSISALETHLAGHLEAVATEYGCHACLKSFGKPDELQKHLLDIHASHLYRCALCRQVFDSKVSIQVHFAVKHSNETKIHKCLKCSIKFRSQAEFDAHLREIHLHTRSENAHAVNGAFHSHESSTLKVGRTTSSVARGFRCLLCPSTLSSEAEMTAHIATHERQFKCSLCEEAFHVEFLLDKHMQSMHVQELNGTHSIPRDVHKSSMSPRQGGDLRCGICDTHFTSESALSMHRKQAHGAKSPSTKVMNSSSLSLFCAYCNEVCKSRNDLEAHMKASHVGAGIGRHKCNICDEIFSSPPSLAQHKLSHVKVLSSGAQCIVCRENLISADQIKCHQNDHHGIVLPQPCVVCRQTMTTDVEINVHAKYHTFQVENGSQPKPKAELHEVEPSIDSQSNLYVDRDRIENKDWKMDIKTLSKKENIKEEHNGWSDISSGRTYQCIKCQESFASEVAIEAHVASHLEQEGSSHLCHLCRTYFDTPLRLQCHLIEHTFEGHSSFTCYLCASVFTTASRLQQHMVTHGLSSKPYDCHHCRQSFFFRAELENHLPTHIEAANGCRDCQATFPSGIQGRTMGEPLRINCSACPYIALSNGELRAHSVIHNPVLTRDLSPRTSSVQNEPAESLECKTCSKKCRSLASLRLHNLTHEGGKPYLCSECGNAFTRRCEAAKHATQHKKPREHQKCIPCQQEFPPSEDMMAHLKKLHEGPDTHIARPDSRCSSCDGEETSPLTSPIDS